MTQLNLALAAAGLLALGLGAVSGRLERSLLQEPMIAVAAGVAIGPFALDLLDVTDWGDEGVIREEAARLTLAVALMGSALRLDRDDLRALWRPATVLLTLAMLGMWALSSLLAGMLFALPMWTAALVGAAVTPTDPVTASAIVTGDFAKRHLPERLRAGLTLESGGNDGLAYLLLFLPVLMLAHPPGEAWERWLLDRLLVGVVVATVLGVAIGWGAARLLHAVRARGWVENYSFLTYTVALSLFTLGATELAGADALISVFVAGLVFTVASDTGDKHEEENVQEAIAKLFTLPMFFLIGLSLPWDDWARLGWPVAAFALGLLLLRRPPVLALLGPLLRPTYGARDRAYLGWFGPVGVAAVFYASLAERETGIALAWHLGSAAVLASVLVHGITAAPLTRLYGRAAGGGEAPPRS